MESNQLKMHLNPPWNQYFHFSFWVRTMSWNIQSISILNSIPAAATQWQKREKAKFYFSSFFSLSPNIQHQQQNEKKKREEKNEKDRKKGNAQQQVFYSIFMRCREQNSKVEEDDVGGGKELLHVLIPGFGLCCPGLYPVSLCSLPSPLATL